MHEIVRHAQVRAEQVGLNESDDSDQKEHDTKKFADSFSHRSFLSLLFEKSVYNRERSHRVSQRTLPRVFKLRAKAGMGGLYTIEAVCEQGFSTPLFPAHLHSLSANLGECYTH